MTAEQFIKQELDITEPGEYGDNNSYVVVLENSNEFGKVFSKLEKSDAVYPLEESQVVTEEGSSVLYKAEDEDLLFNLLADFEGNVYQLVVTEL